jgi:WD40 repeat protein
MVTHRTSHAIAPGEAVAAIATNEPAETQVWSPEHQQHMTFRIRDPSIAGSLVRLFDLETGSELLRLRAHSESVEAIAFHPSAKQLATASSDQAIVWDLATGAQAGRLWGITNALDRLAYSADGKHIVGAHRASDKIWIWPSEGGAPLSTTSGFGRFDAVVAWEQDSASAHAYVENDETIVASTGRDIVLARFPAALQWLARHPRRPVWAGAAGRHVHLLALEPI